MDHVDLIIMGGYFGEGRRKGISHFLLGAAVPPATEGERVCVRLLHSSEKILTLDQKSVYSS
jgi:ATP-dependent DNA ligase